MKTFLGLIFIFHVSYAHAGTVNGPFFTYEGVLTDTTGSPFNNITKKVTFEILVNVNCVVFREEKNIFFDNFSNGEFSVGIGGGANLIANGNDRIFAVSGNVTCDGGAVQALSGFAPRLLRIKVADQNGANQVTLSPDLQINHVPTALNAQRLEDKSATDFLQTSGAITQSNVNDLLSRYNVATSTLSTNITGTAASATNANHALTATTATTANSATTATTAQGLTGTLPLANGGTNATTAAGARTSLGLGSLAVMSPGGVANNTTFLRGDGTWAAPTSSVTSVAGRTGAVMLTDADISGLGTAATKNVGTAANNVVQLDASARLPAVDGSALTNIAMMIDQLTNANGKYFNYKPNNTACTNGQLLAYSTTANGWVCQTASGGSVTSVTAALPLTSTGGATPQISMIAATAATDGYLTQWDWLTFNNKQNALGYTPLDPANNLSDVANASTARTNLGLGSLAVQSTLDLSTQSSGTLPTARLPAFTGAVTTSAGSNITNITAGAVQTSHLADGSVTNIKIDSISGSKVSGNITGYAANVTGTVAVGNGGTGTTNGSIQGTSTLLLQSGAGNHILLDPGAANVGIGTASPAYKLSVAGDTSLDGVLVQPVTINGQVTTVDFSTSNFQKVHFKCPSATISLTNIKGDGRYFVVFSLNSGDTPLGSNCTITLTSTKTIHHKITNGQYPFPSGTPFMVLEFIVIGNEIFIIGNSTGVLTP